MAGQNKVISARFPVEWVDELDDHADVYNESRTDALKRTVELGMRAEEPRVYQVELPRDMKKEFEAVVDERGEGEEEALRYLLRRGLRGEEHDVFLAEFPADDTGEILRIADRERLDRDAALRQLVEKGLATVDGEASDQGDAVGVETPGKLVIFGLILFVLASTPPEGIPIYSQNISEWLVALSLSLVVFGIGLFTAMPLMDFLNRAGERAREYYHSRRNDG